MYTNYNKQLAPITHVHVYQLQQTTGPNNTFVCEEIVGHGFINTNGGNGNGQGGAGSGGRISIQSSNTNKLNVTLKSYSGKFIQYLCLLKKKTITKNITTKPVYTKHIEHFFFI
jgi:hypothetical protein